jgi:hypothetical protein
LFQPEAPADDGKVIPEDAAEERSSGVEDTVPNAEYPEEGDTGRRTPWWMMPR